MRVEGLELAAQAGTALGGDELDEAVVAARAAVDAAPFRESCWARLIEALRAQGDAAAALRAFDELRDLLAEELGAEPSWEVAALREALLRETEGRPPRASPGGVAPPAGRAARPAGAPLPARGSSSASGSSARSTLCTPRCPRRGAGGGHRGAGGAREDAAARRDAAQGGRGRRAGPHRPRERARARLPVRRRPAAPRGRAGRARPRRARCSPAPPRPPRRLRHARRRDEEATASFAVLHGLYWAIVHLSADRPLVLAVDDLHWVDQPSLRLARLPRPPPRGAARSSSSPRCAPASRAADPGPPRRHRCTTPRRCPSARGRCSPPRRSTQVVRDRFGPQATDAFCAACHRDDGQQPASAEPASRRARVRARRSDRRGRPAASTRSARAPSRGQSMASAGADVRRGDPASPAPSRCSATPRTSRRSPSSPRLDVPVAGRAFDRPRPRGNPARPSQPLASSTRSCATPSTTASR